MPADHGLTANQIEDLIATAEAGASNSWEEDFVTSQRERFTQYGEAMFLSPRQVEVLEKIGCGCGQQDF